MIRIGRESMIHHLTYAQCVSIADGELSPHTRNVVEVRSSGTAPHGVPERLIGDVNNGVLMVIEARQESGADAGTIVVAPRAAALDRGGIGAVVRIDGAEH